MGKALNLNWKHALLLLGYPILLSFILEITVQETTFSTYDNLLENILFSILVFIIINQLIILKFGRLIVNFIIVLYYFFLLIESGLYLLFQTRMNAAYIYIILNTNFNEAKEFSLVFYKDNLFWLVLFFVPLVGFFPKRIFNQNKFKLWSFIKTILIGFVLVVFLKYCGLMKWNLPYVAFKSFIQYEKQLEDFEKFKNAENNLNAITTSENDVIVVIIGESTTRRHMNLYGYSRKNTPRLLELSDSLIVYKNVISPHVYTTASIFDTFTLSNYENRKADNSLLQYIKAAGYKVFWLSNQRPVGLHDNLVVRLAAAADESVFLSYNDFRQATLYDEVLLPMLDEKLEVKEKKVIFVHLIGTHFDYKNRYPEEYSVFSSKGENSQNKIVDTYDNAILYNDYIVSEIINRVQRKSEKSAVLYFSDHGEEVFDTVDYFGHFDNKPTSAMYEIPFLLYMTPSFEKPTDFYIDENRKYMLDDFPHSLTHLMGVKSELLNNSRSIFSKNFKTRKRFIQDSITFESFKAKEN